MRVLWITHDVLPEFAPFVSGDYSLGGSWIPPLFYSLAENEDIELGIVSPVVNGAYLKKEIDGIQYFSIPIVAGGNTRHMSPDTVENYIKVIDAFEPDIIHIHGVEKNFGLLTKYINRKLPVVCSIQGIINSYYDSLKLSAVSFDKLRFKSIKTLLGMGGGIKAMAAKWEKYCVVEKEIIEINQYFIGRTEWDKSQICAMNPNALYFHGEELLRADFYSKKWEAKKCERHSIFMSSGAYSIKGLHLMIQAMSLLVEKYPNLKLYVPLFNHSNSKWKRLIFGNEYNNYISHLINVHLLKENIIFLPRLSAASMADLFLKSHVFALPSYVENSPNSLGEAMMVGTPSVVSYCGGVGSIIDNESALISPVGDFRMLAFQLDRIFQSDEFSSELSQRSHLIADKRHDVEKTTESYINIYKDIININ